MLTLTAITNTTPIRTNTFNTFKSPIRTNTLNTFRSPDHDEEEE